MRRTEFDDRSEDCGCARVDTLVRMRANRDPMSLAILPVDSLHETEIPDRLHTADFFVEVRILEIRSEKYHDVEGLIDARAVQGRMRTRQLGRPKTLRKFGDAIHFVLHADVMAHEL